MTSPNEVKRDDKASFSTIQVLRFVAALMVVLTHSSFTINANYDNNFPRIDLGANGVNLFFAISGFVMVLSSQKLVEMGQGWRIFLVNRLIRIVPLYWLMTTLKIALMVGASSLFVARSELDFSHILKAYLFLPALDKENMYRPIVGVGWTLNLEMFFYFIFAACLLLRLPRVLTASFALVVLAILPLLHLNLWPVLSFYTDTIILNFIWGMLAAHLFYKGVKLNPVIAGVAVVLGLLFLLVPLSFFKSGSLNFALNNLMVFCVVFGAVSAEASVKKYLHVVLRYFGDASYSLYLVHTSVIPIVPMLIRKAGIANSALCLLGCVSISLIAAAFLYTYVENPMTQKLRYLTDSSRKKLVTSSGLRR